MKNKVILRILEIIPAVFSWGAIILPMFFINIFPNVTIIFTLTFCSLWLMRVVEFGSFLLFSFFKFKKALKIDWNQKIADYEKDENLTIQEIANKQKIVESDQFIDPGEILHLVIIPTYKEDVGVLRQTINHIKSANFNQKKIFLCLATEERDHELGTKNAQILQKEFKSVFKDFFHFEHPDGIAGEVKGKGSNITHAGRESAKVLKKQKFDFSKIIVTTLDADNCVHKDYFSLLTYVFSTTLGRKNKTFQPLSLFFNNIWDVPVLNRIAAFSIGFWNMFENAKPDRMNNFAAHAQPLDALVEMDFWSTKTIVEDGHQFWRSLLHFRGKYSVVPIFMPIFVDAFQGKTYFRSLKGQFLQMRRWAWGVTDIPFMIINWWKMRKQIPFFDVFMPFYRLCEGHFLWATMPLMIMITIPVSTILDSNKDSIFTSNYTFLTQTIFTYPLVGLLIAMLISFVMVPSPKKKWQKPLLLLQWLLLPIGTIAFGAFPALTAQTILAIGKKLEFNVTPKIRKI